MTPKHSECVFCRQIANPSSEQFFEDPSGLFIAKWDIHPERPGHALVIPKRHVQYFHDLTEQELAAIAPAAEATEEIILKTNLAEMYDTVFASVTDRESLEFINAAKAMLKTNGSRQPDGFNDWINDGPVAGQMVPHLHWHIIPRWAGDMPDPEGGMRRMFDGSENPGQTGSQP